MLDWDVLSLSPIFAIVLLLDVCMNWGAECQSSVNDG